MHYAATIQTRHISEGRETEEINEGMPLNIILS